MKHEVLITIKNFSCLDSAFDAVKDIRFRVFCEEQHVPVSEEIDGYDSRTDTIYVLVYADGVPAATGRLIFTEKGVRLGRIATLKTCRGMGLGAVVVNNLCLKAAKAGVKTVSLDAQCQAIPFYEKCGFHTVSDEVFLDAGIPHKLMIKEL